MSYKRTASKRIQGMKELLWMRDNLEKKWLKSMWGCSLQLLASWRKWRGSSMDKIKMTQIKQLGGSFKTAGGSDCLTIHKLCCSWPLHVMSGVYISLWVIRRSVGEKLACATQQSEQFSIKIWALTALKELLQMLIKNYCWKLQMELSTEMCKLQSICR